MSNTFEIVVVDDGDDDTTVEFRKNGEVQHAQGGQLSLAQVDAAIAHYRSLAPSADTYWTDRAESYRAPDSRTIDISGMPWGNLASTDALSPEPTAGGQALADEPTDDAYWYYAFQIDEIPQRLTPDEAANYTGPFETPELAFSACLQEHDAYEERLKAERDALRDTVRKLADARVTMLGYVELWKQQASEGYTITSTYLKEYREGKAHGMERAIELLPAIDKDAE